MVVRFNLIVPFYKNYDTIEALLRSIQDQDYKDFDVTIVVDGEDERAGKQLTAYLDEGKYSFNLEMLNENSGASKARNYGAGISCQNLLANNTDSILFFIDADCKLMPGILYDFNTQFELDPEIDFCYGNYRFELDKPPFISQSFDPYLLESMNYIPTMSPVRRSAFEEVNGFDDRKYFQDWGLFYKLAKAGKKGKYLGDKYFVFSTKSPTEDSISGSQGLTLAEKCTEFREYYGITHKEMVATTWGAPLQAIQRAKMLGADYIGAGVGSDRMVFPSNYHFPNWKYTYMTGCYNQTISALENHMTSIVGRPIYHFIGTDVFTMFNLHSMAALIDIKKMFEAQNAVLLSNSSRCKDELSKCGLETELVFTPVYNMEQYKSKEPLPEKFTVAVLVSNTNRAHKLDGAGGHSNIPLIQDVARAMPDIEFKFFGIEGMYDKTGNVEFCGRIPETHMVDFINECSMVLRSTIHDGFPQAPIQFMLCGRQALVSCPDEEFKYAEKMSFEDNLDWETNKREMITKIYEMSKKKDDFLSIPAKEYYKELMSEETFIKKIYSLVEEKESK
jgi:glycosyltransferase involved in cell wall biosynthesis